MGSIILEDLVRCLHLRSEFKRRQKIKTDFIQKSIGERKSRDRSGPQNNLFACDSTYKEISKQPSLRYTYYARKSTDCRDEEIRYFLQTNTRMSSETFKLRIGCREVPHREDPSRMFSLLGSRVLDANSTLSTPHYSGNHKPCQIQSPFSEQ